MFYFFSRYFNGENLCYAMFVTIALRVVHIVRAQITWNGVLLMAVLCSFSIVQRTKGEWRTRRATERWGERGEVEAEKTARALTSLL